MFWECHNPTQKNRQGNDIELNTDQQYTIEVKIIKKLY